MALSSAASVLKKVAARSALVNVDPATTTVLRDCFRQFGIDAHTVPPDHPHRLQREKVDALVLGINDQALPILEAVRNSASNKRAVLFGICDNLADANVYSRFGMNVLLQRPIDRQSALRAVRTTHLLIIHEFRRYARIPIIARFDALSGARHITGNTVEISGGGMSIRHKGSLGVNDDIQLTFDLPGRSGIKIRGLICWVRPADSMAGVRFEPVQQPARLAIREWIDEYLDIL